MGCLVVYGPRFGYYPNALKTVIIAKEDAKDEAADVFKDTGIEINVAGKRYLGGALGAEEFLERYIEEKDSSWVTEVEQLSSFAKSQPHAAVAAFTHGLCHRWTYLTRVLPVTGSLLQPLEDAIRQKFIPSLTGQPPCNDQMRKLLALPPKQGGLGIINPLMLKSYSTSATICQPLVEAILGQGGRPLKIRSEQH